MENKNISEDNKVSNLAETAKTLDDTDKSANTNNSVDITKMSGDIINSATDTSKLTTNSIAKPTVNSIKKSQKQPIIQKETNLFVDFKGNPLRVRNVYRRNVFLSILYSILLIPFYPIFWIFEIDKETKVATKKYNGPASYLIAFLSVITCGIYTIYWAYKMGEKHSSFFETHGIDKPKLKIKYSVTLIAGWVFSLFVAILVSIVIGTTQGSDTGNLMAIGILFFFVIGFFANIVCELIAYSLMQSNLNKIIDLNKNEIICRDSNLLNRPILSFIMLFLIASVPTFVQDEVHNLIYGRQVIPTEADAMNYILKKNAEGVANANMSGEIFSNLSAIITAILLLWWFALRFKHSKYDGVLHAKNLSKALLLCLPAFAIAIMNAVGLFANGQANISIGVIIVGCVPGFVEEIEFRGMIVPNLIRIYNNKRGIWIALFVSSIFFGAIHIANATVGADLSTSFYQAFYAFGLGMIFAATLIRTGTLWASIICHSTIDALAMMDMRALQSGAIQVQQFEFNTDTILTALLTVVFVVFSIWLCRSSKHEEILNMWRDKFGNAMRFTGLKKKEIIA